MFKFLEKTATALSSQAIFYLEARLLPWVAIPEDISTAALGRAHWGRIVMGGW